MRPQQGQMQSPTPWANWLASDWTGQLRAVSESSCRNVLSVGLHGSATARQSPRLRNPRGTMRIPTESTCRRRGKIQSPIRRPILSPLLMLGRNIPRIPHIPRRRTLATSPPPDPGDGELGNEGREGNDLGPNDVVSPNADKATPGWRGRL